MDQERLLPDISNIRPVSFSRLRIGNFVIDPYFPCIGRQEPQQQIENGGLSPAGRPGNSDKITGCYPQTKLLQHKVTAIAKLNIFKLNGPDAFSGPPPYGPPPSCSRPRPGGSGVLRLSRQLLQR